MSDAQRHPQPVHATAGRVVFTSILGLAVLTIATLALSGTILPSLETERGTFLAIAAIGFLMCLSSGIERTTPAEWRPTSTIAAILGILALLAVVAVLAGWTSVLDPIGDLVFGTRTSPDRVGIVALSVLIVGLWLMSTLRQLGITGTAT